jgi:hypothetical protein
VTLIIRWGPDATSELLRRSARCTKCGREGAVLQHPSWAGMYVGFEPFPVNRPCPSRKDGVTAQTGIATRPPLRRPRAKQLGIWLGYFSVARAAVAATIRECRAGGRPCRGKIDAVAIYRSLKRAMPARSCYGEAVFASGEHTLELLTSRGTTGNVATSMGFQ